MMGLVPTFGIDGYVERVSRVMADAPREMPLVEGVVLAGLAAVAGLLLIVALFRRSAVAAVGFSFLALVGMIAALLFGRLDFVAPATQILLMCLAACSLLLFVTATVRVARDNPLMGIVILMAIAAILAVAGGSVVGVIDGAPLMRLGIAVAFGITAFCLLIDALRRDRPTLVVAPGLVAVMASPALMSMVARGPASDWLMVALPILVLAAGAIYSAVAALAVLTMARQAAGGASHPAKPMAVPMPAAVPMMREVEMTDAPNFGTASEEPLDVDALDHGPISNLGADEPVEMSESDAPARHDYAAAPTFAREAAPVSSPRFDAAAAEPVSAHWGRGEASAGQRGPILAPDEYVWDQMAAQEVKMGDEFTGMFDLPSSVVVSPDVLRDAIAAGSLADFDDHILGGAQPITGRFDVELTTAAGGRVMLSGRRQVDPDGVLIRLEATGRVLAAAPNSPQAAGLAAAAAPLTASRGRAAAPDISTALERGEIVAYFQPIVRLADRVTVGFEALARWHQADGTVVDAKDFVPALTKQGKALALAELVLNQSARELAAWIAAEPGQGQFVAVNIEASDLAKSDLTDVVGRVVKAYALPPGALVVELTEGRIQTSQSKALAAAKAIRQAGASLAIDDFGVGFSTLNRLSKFRFDLIKTDQSLIADLSNKKALAFMKTLLATAQKQGSPVIAEGVEDEETAAKLAEMGCDFAQGYLFGRAEPIGDGAPAEVPAHDPATELR